MKQILFFALLFLPYHIHAQTNIVSIPPAPVIAWCAHPANAVPCTNKVTTYTDATLTTPCPTSRQIVLDGTTSCVASPDSQNNWGVWVGPGAYDYTITVGGSNFGPFYVTMPCVSTGCTITSPTITTPTINNPTITTPIINGTPSGTGIPTITQKLGSAGGNYTTTSLTFVDIDATNLAFTVTIPTGWKLIATASGVAGVLTASVAVNIGIFDSIANNVSGIANITNLTTTNSGFTSQRVITGDGNSHTVKLQFDTTNASDSAVIVNVGGAVPQMVFTLSPSN